MKRMGLNVASSLLTFTFGLCLYALFGFVMRSDEARESSASFATPATSEAHARIEADDEARPHEDFRQFWAEFKSAVEREDIDGVYALTKQEGFVWPARGKRNGRERCTSPSVSFEPPGLLIGPDCYYLIGDREEFAREYHSIFTRTVKRAILKREPIPNWPGSYILNGPLGGEPYARTLMFVDEGHGFKFAGTWETLPRGRDFRVAFD